MTRKRFNKSRPKDIALLYEQGLAGVVCNPEADLQLREYLEQNGQYAYADAAIDDYKLAGSGEGKLSLPFLAAMTLYPGCLPGGAQGRGSCVAWSTRNAALVSYCAYIVYGENAERYTAPVVSPVGIDGGVAATEGIYWFRGHSGDGWQCSAAAQVAISKCGLLLRQRYDELGLDLTRYSAATEGKWGRLSPPDEVIRVTEKNICKNATNCTSYEQCRDMIANGYALSTCGIEAFVSNRDAYGICDRSMARWAHAMAAIACDDRPETIQREGSALFLIQNSWGNNAVSGPSRIWGTNYDIPPGSFWARWSDIKNRSFIALGPSKGWPANKLPDWGLGGIV